MTLELAQQALERYFGYKTFRPLQANIIQNVFSKQDTLVLMPTGGGKSICYQIPAVVSEGLCIVISPLIALMKDQVESLKANGISAAFLNSSLQYHEQQQIEQDLRNGNIKLLYVSPEKLMKPNFLFFLDTLTISLFAVDEAHCISSWGHDFRQEYTQLKVIKNKFPSTPIIALTATADKITREDICKQLHLNNPTSFVASFDRPNLSLTVLPAQKRVQGILKFLKSRPHESGIIYCLSRKTTESLAEKLRNAGYDAIHYHAGMEAKKRAKAQEDFVSDHIPIVCATIAFGMGIDKSNVRWVIHYNLPKNIESYYQEIGRAGRDGLKSDTLLFYSYADVMTLQNFAKESGQAELQLAKLQRMQQFADSMICRRKILLSYFGESLSKDCGNCDVCKNPPRRFDGTIIAQKALSALVRLEEKVGANLLIDVLRGSQRQEIWQKGYNRIKTFGAGQDISFNHWKAYLQQFIQLGLLEIAYDQKNTLKVTDFGKEVLFGKKKIELVELSAIQKRLEEKVTAKQNKTKKAIFTDMLFQELRTLRQTIAAQEGVPPYIVFSDASLKDMASKRPTHKREFRAISGVGDRKLQAYGHVFMDAILNFIQQESLKGTSLPQGSTMLVTWKFYLDGLSPEEIAKKRDLNPVTVYSHLAALYEKGYDINLLAHIGEDELKQIVAVIGKQFGKDAPLKDIFSYFDEKISYHKIRLAMAHFKVKNPD